MDMSKNVVVWCTITQVNPMILKKAMGEMMKHLDGRLTHVNDYKFQFYCEKLSFYNVTIKIENQLIKISGEESNVKRVQETVEQFYKAMMLEELQNCIHSEIEKQDILLEIEV